mmetsp:Transcript_26821/g.86207  ORF Transcript_26821/g.86207 Transcript_26821/m.86207 type:complete len:212 (+) Transcript_26821:185-820(+)
MPRTDGVTGLAPTFIFCSGDMPPKWVATKPGEIATTAMPCGLRSLANDLDTMLTAALDVRYAYMPPLLLSAIEPIIDEITTSLPPGADSCGSSACVTRSTLSVLSSKPRRIASMQMVSSFCSARDAAKPPALCTMQSSLTPASAAFSVSPTESLVTSTPCTRTTSPATWLSSSTPLAEAAGVRHVAYTRSPRAASCLTSSRPRPAEQPVTR